MISEIDRLRKQNKDLRAQLEGLNRCLKTMETFADQNIDGLIILIDQIDRCQPRAKMRQAIRDHARAMAALADDFAAMLRATAH